MVESLTFEERFNKLMERDQTSPNDSERKALFYILSGNEDLYKKVTSIYDFDNHWIKSDCFEKVDFSGGAYRMVQLAFNLYNGSPAPDPLELFSSLDQYNFRICINAIFLRFGFEE